jgi:hypothetical protein
MATSYRRFGRVVGTPAGAFGFYITDANAQSPEETGTRQTPAVSVSNMAALYGINSEFKPAAAHILGIVHIYECNILNIGSY